MFIYVVAVGELPSGLAHNVDAARDQPSVRIPKLDGASGDAVVGDVHDCDAVLHTVHDVQRRMRQVELPGGVDEHVQSYSQMLKGRLVEQQ